MTRIIGGRGKGRRLSSPAGDQTRPTGARVRQSLFDILAPVLPGSRFLDACAGSGGVGIEALSRGASRVVFVDPSRAAVAAIRANMDLLGGSGADVYQQDARVALRALSGRGERFDIVFLDPPYDSDLYEPLLQAAASCLDPSGVVVAEHFHKRGLPATIGGLARAREVRMGDHRLSFYRFEEPL